MIISYILEKKRDVRVKNTTERSRFGSVVGQQVAALNQATRDLGPVVARDLGPLWTIITPAIEL